MAPRLFAAIWAVAIFAVAGFSDAAAETPYSFSVNVGLDSVSVFRGIRSHRLNPSPSAGVDLEYGDAYGGVFVNPVAFGEETNVLVLGYTGYAPSALGFDFDVGARYFSFPGSNPLEIDLDGDSVIDHVGKKGVFESFVGVSKKFGALKLSARFLYTPQSLGETDPAYYSVGKATVELPHGFDISGHYGRSGFSDDLINDDYDDFSVGVSKTLFGLDLDLRYSDTIGRVGLKDQVVVIRVSKEFTIMSDEKRRDRRYEKIRNDWVIDKSIFGLAR